MIDALQSETIHTALHSLSFLFSSCFHFDFHHHLLSQSYCRNVSNRVVLIFCFFRHRVSILLFHVLVCHDILSLHGQTIQIYLRLSVDYLISGSFGNCALSSAYQVFIFKKALITFVVLFHASEELFSS